MQTAFQRHSFRKPFSLFKFNLTEVMDKIIATVDCAFQWFQLWKIASHDVSPVTFAEHLLFFTSTVFIINIEGGVNNVCVKRTK